MSRTTINRAPEDRAGSLYESWIRERAPHKARLRALWAMTPAASKTGTNDPVERGPLPNRPA